MIKTNDFFNTSWGHCLSIKNDQVELLIPYEFGPRVIHYGFLGEKNHFAEFPAHKADQNQEKWHSYGGHRLWHGPEDLLRTYIPDNDPISIDSSNTSILLKQKIEARTQLQKTMEIRLDPTGTHVQITHRIYNHSLFEIRLAVWAVSVMATQGRAILPLPPRGSHGENLRAQTSLNLWAYTNLKDTRWQFGQKHITFSQDPANSDPQKIGISRSGGWLAYLNENQAFIKKCAYVENQSYPDENSTFEIYADHKCVELESLSPLTTIAPGNCAELVEDWALLKEIDRNAPENELDQRLPQAFL